MMLNFTLKHVIVGYIVGHRLSEGFVVRPTSLLATSLHRLPSSRNTQLQSAIPSDKNTASNEEVQEHDPNWLDAYAEVVQDDPDEEDDDFDWIPDRDKAKMLKEVKRMQRVKKVDKVDKEDLFDYLNERQRAKNEEAEAKKKAKKKKKEEGESDSKEQDRKRPHKPHKYSDEQEELIRAMGGKGNTPTKRQPGYLGDSTLMEIATDFGAPVCYMADVLCTWGVPPPINVRERLGDMVTGEQAFAMVEALHSLDPASLQDRYSTTSFLDVCENEGIDLRNGFEMCMKEGWSLPFGVHSFLRTEQERELIRALGDSIGYGDEDDEDDDIDYAYSGYDNFRDDVGP